MLMVRLHILVIHIYIIEIPFLFKDFLRRACQQQDSVGRELMQSGRVCALARQLGILLKCSSSKFLFDFWKFRLLNFMKWNRSFRDSPFFCLFVFKFQNSVHSACVQLTTVLSSSMPFSPT